MIPGDLMYSKVKEIIDELKMTGLWRNEPPVWVIDYRQRLIATEQEFLEWLQFVYLPNLLPGAGNHNVLLAKNYVAPQAVKFFTGEVKNGKLLQLLIELDSLS
ncbi:MAG: YqcC family protein [Chitinophagaceae bacterium]|nr:YqcC family protein [Chitinophagaceae bacterium]